MAQNSSRTGRGLSDDDPGKKPQALLHPSQASLNMPTHTVWGLYGRESERLKQNLAAHNLRAGEESWTPPAIVSDLTRVCLQYPLLRMATAFLSLCQLPNTAIPPDKA